MIITLLVSFCSLSRSQILTDEKSLTLVKELTDYIYNLQFDEGDVVFKKIRKMYPDHPAVLLLNAIITYWKNFPLTAASPGRYSFEADLRACIKSCENINSSAKAEILLTNLSARGLLLLFYSDNKLTWEVMPLAAGTYKYLRDAFGYKNSYDDFYYFTGLYNYYREAYPEAHPIYKSFAFIFPRGDKVSGLKELGIASESSIFLKAESSSFLSYIYQNYEKDFRQAAYHTRRLKERYPGNGQYLLGYIKNLLLEAKYEETEAELLKSASFEKNLYFRASFNILEGILKEKKYKDLASAEKLFLQGIRDIRQYGDYGSEFTSYAYFGLSRISAAKGDAKQERIYRNLARDHTDFWDINFDDP